jgi:hypothetical protein
VERLVRALAEKTPSAFGLQFKLNDSGGCYHTKYIKMNMATTIKILLIDMFIVLVIEPVL